MADEIDLIRSRINIVDLVGQRVSLKKAGRHFKGLCPFHDDHKPSFQVSPDIGRYTCWSCGAKGDIFNWVMETQRVDFSEALRLLAAQAGVTLSRSGRKEPSKRESYQNAMRLAQEFFRAQLKESAAARGYCERRDLDEETLATWGIGYAPDVGEALAGHLKRNGMTLADAREVFLVEKDASGGFYDRFRGRLMFPIRDERGDLVAFGGRIIGEGQPKYINSGDTPIFSKSRVLYGLDRAKDAIAKTGIAVLVEGYLDVIACHKAAMTNAVATLGTALAEDHVRILKRWTNSVVVLYDSDEAGLKAADRACELLSAGGIRVRVALLDKGHDPDTLVKEGGRAALSAVVEGAVSPMDHRIKQIQRQYKPEQQEYWTEIVGALARAETPIEMETYIAPLAAQYPGTRDQAAAQRALRRMVAQSRRKAPAAAPRTVKGDTFLARTSKISGPEAAVLQGLLNVELVKTAWDACIAGDLMVAAEAIAVARAVTDAFPDGPPQGPAATWLTALQDDTARDLLSDLAMADDSRLTAEAFKDALERLKVKRARRQAADLADSATKDDASLEEIMSRLRALHKSSVL